MTALDRFIEGLVNKSDEKVAIRFPECPRCKQQIRLCTRYMPIINQLHNLIAQVKKKILGNHSEQEKDKRRKRLIDDFEQSKSKLSEINLGQMKTFFETLYDSDNLFSDDMLTLMENILLFLHKIDKLLIDGRKRLPINIFEDLVSIDLFYYMHSVFSMIYLFYIDQFTS